MFLSEKVPVGIQGLFLIARGVKEREKLKNT